MKNVYIISCLFVVLFSVLPVYAESYFGVININNSSTKSNCTKGNGEISSKKRTIGAFEQILVSGAFTVSLQCGKGDKVILEADSNILPLIQTELVGNILQINSSSSICVDHPITVSLMVPQVVTITSEGSNEILMDCGTGYDTLSLNLSGASKFKLVGNGDTLTANLEDATELDASGGKVNIAKVSASGSSIAVISVRQDLVAESSDASEIYYDGLTARIRKTVSDASDVLPLSEK